MKSTIEEFRSMVTFCKKTTYIVIYFFFKCELKLTVARNVWMNKFFSTYMKLEYRQALLDSATIQDHSRPLTNIQDHLRPAIVLLSLLMNICDYSRPAIF